MVNAKTRKACEKRVNAQMMSQIPRADAKIPGGKRFTKTMRNKMMAIVKPIVKAARKMCGMTEKQQKKAAENLFSKMYSMTENQKKIATKNLLSMMSNRL